MPDRHIRRLGADYADVLAALLPIGQAWPREPDSTLIRTVRGLAEYYGFVDRRAADLLERESDPRITLELLIDWERNWGLPDPCYQEPFTIGDRQIALVQRMTIEGAQSRKFFIGVALGIGYVISISEYRPFMVGLDRVGDNRIIGDGSGTQQNERGYPLLNSIGLPVALDEYSEYPYMLGQPENRFYWTVHVGRARLTWFRCGSGGGECGIDPHLLIGLATDLECLLRRWAPAHSQIIFDYSGLVTGGSLAGTP